MSYTTHPPDTTSGITTSWIPVASNHNLEFGCTHSLTGSINATYVGQSASIYYMPTAYRPQLSPAGPRCLPSQVTTSYYNYDSTFSTIYTLGPFACPASY